jgi:hypothetical protein
MTNTTSGKQRDLKYTYISTLASEQKYSYLHKRTKEYLFVSPTATDWVILATFSRTFSITTTIVQTIYRVLLEYFRDDEKNSCKCCQYYSFTTNMKTYLLQLTNCVCNWSQNYITSWSWRLQEKFWLLWASNIISHAEVLQIHLL